MKYSNNQIEFLKGELYKRLSEKRFRHTIGVYETAIELSGYFSGIDISEISVAALLHDVSKELSCDEESQIINKLEGLTEDDKLSFSVFHSFTAPYIVKRDFPDFASDNVLSAVRNHTTGAYTMSVFDEIVFISDYIEPTRKYVSCIELRRNLLSSLACLTDETERLIELHKASLESIENTINAVLKQGRTLNKRTLETKKYLVDLIKELKNERK